MIELDDFYKWILRIFGTVDAYQQSLPARFWWRGPCGWVSSPR